jgi:hypothetical protein
VEWVITEFYLFEAFIRSLRSGQQQRMEKSNWAPRHAVRPEVAGHFLSQLHALGQMQYDLTKRRSCRRTVIGPADGGKPPVEKGDFWVKQGAPSFKRQGRSAEDHVLSTDRAMTFQRGGVGVASGKTKRDWFPLMWQPATQDTGNTMGFVFMQ